MSERVMTTAEKNAIANDAEAALWHRVVVSAMGEYAGNMGFDLSSGLPSYGLRKVCRCVAIVARCDALGIDPDAMVMTDEEAAETLRGRLRAALDGDTPVIVVVDTDGGDGS